MKYYILTDLEGPAGVATWDQTRVDKSPEKSVAMRFLTAEVNACIDGILDEDPGAEIVVLDGHGSGGIDMERIHPRAQVIWGKGHRLPNGMDESFDALLFVGQHAMAGTPDAPLCHTYSSLHVEYYKLNGQYIGEFGCRALLAGSFGVPTIFLAGDDKACQEAEAFIPGIVTVATKIGMGIELALHLSPEESCRRIRRAAAEAVQKRDQIPPVVWDPPYELEIRVQEGRSVEGYLRRGAEPLDERTCRFRVDSLLKLPI
ncbi:MAG: amino acid amidase [Candidatus Poribacteria bacterium]|nr:MAG: amino acid amidase [Candidatus Poribacteria bacterium]